MFKNVKNHSPKNIKDEQFKEKSAKKERKEMEMRNNMDVIFM